MSLMRLSPEVSIVRGRRRSQAMARRRPRSVFPERFVFPERSVFPVSRGDRLSTQRRRRRTCRVKIETGSRENSFTCRMTDPIMLLK
jgi:hypothetical protein